MAIKAHKLKALQAREELLAEMDAHKRELIRTRRKLEKIMAESLLVTEHALLRYVERVLGVDLQEIEDAILTDSVREIIEFSGGDCRIKSGGMILVVKNRCVVSVLADD